MQNIKKGDYVSRNSYNNDTIFKVINIKDGIVYLKGMEVRLCADAPIEDIKIEENIEEDNVIDEMEVKEGELTRGEYFYLPAKVLHIDADNQLSNEASNPYKIRENTNFKKYKKSQKKQKISNFS